MAGTDDVEPTIGAVLCGGRSSRFGSDKALAPMAETTMGGHVIEALRAAGVDPVVAIGGTAGSALGVPTVPDLWPGEGPLAGLATALLWAKQGLVVVVPCDLPRLTADQVRAVVDGARANPGQVAVSSVEGRPQVSLACWPAGAGRALRDEVKTGERRFRRALDVVPSIEIPVDGSAVTDADTPAQLRRILEIDRP